MIETVALAVAAVALGLAALALWFAWDARGDARVATSAVRTLATAVTRRKREDRPQQEQLVPEDEREVNLGPPREVGERRRRDDGPIARHRADAPPRPHVNSRLVASREAREAAELATTAIPRVEPELPETAEHAAPTSQFRRPPPPLPTLPPPGRIDR